MPKDYGPRQLTMTTKNIRAEAHSVGLLGQLADELGDCQSVGLPDVVEQAEGVVLHHHGVGIDRLLGLVHPALDHLKAWKNIALPNNMVKKRRPQTLKFFPP